MGVAIAIVVVLALAAVGVVLTAGRRRASTGSLSRETRARDRSEVPATVGAPGSELEAAGRERADETRASYSGVPAKRRSGAVTEWEPVDEEEIGFHRRQFLTRAVLGVVALAGIVEFGPAMLAFLWPTSAGGFGGKVTAGNLDDILAGIEASKEPFYVPTARSYVQAYPSDALDAARTAYSPEVYAGMEEGVTALFQKCPHLGCRVPWCGSSQWFECPCHGSKYNAVGEKKDGPAPRGMDRFGVTIEGGKVVIDTGILFDGPPIGVDTTEQQPAGPSCI